MAEETWTCPSCTQALPASVRICPNCGVTQVRSRPEVAPAAPAAPKAPPAEITLPHTVPDVRYTLPVTGDKTWTSGSLLFTEAGLFLISEKDHLPADELALKPPEGPKRLGTNSVFLPRLLVLRVVHDRLKGFFIHAESRKIPLRLSVEGWKQLDAACDRLGIVHE